MLRANLLIESVKYVAVFVNGNAVNILGATTINHMAAGAICMLGNQLRLCFVAMGIMRRVRCVCVYAV